MKTMTAHLVSAYLKHNPVAPGDLPGLIATVHSALSTAGEEAEPVNVAKPAVPIKKSVKPEAITCLECGKTFSMLKRHLTSDHGMSTADYREKWNLDANYPMTAPDYAARRSALARKSGLGRKKTADIPSETDKAPKTRHKKLSLNW
jgi:predicted transcriptional regulator